MGKIVKYCAKCEESFSEKFSFCPNCASAMTAYEMSPLMAEEVKTPEPVKIFEPAEEVVAETQPIEPAVVENIVEPEPPAFLHQATEDDILEFADDDDEFEEEQFTMSEVSAPIEDESITLPSVPVPVVPAPTIQSVAPSNVEDYQRTYQSQTESANFASQTTGGSSYQSTSSNKTLGDDGFYNVTLVQPKNEGTRNMLLFGASALVLSISFGALLYSLFYSDAYVGALDDDLSNIVYVGDEVPAEDPEVEKPKDKDKGGGGGGGGNKEETETSRGRLATQEKEPQIPPSAHMAQVTNPELVLRPATQGDRKEKPSEEPYGDPKGKFDAASDGTGSGGGQGSGEGRGQGSGRGTGAGSGIGSGNGSGIGNGNGGGRGDGTGDRDGDGEPPPVKTGPTTALSITYKPKPPYTDAARQNQVAGTVTLRVTFLANGSIGSVSTVSGLPYGLTENAIAAAKNMKFVPAMKNGVPQSVTKTLAFTFTMY